MDADRQIKLARFLVNRKEVRIVQREIALYSSEENSRRALVLRPAYLLE